MRSTTALATAPLITGMQMNRDEFLCRWEGVPGLKFAELIDEVVYVPSPVSKTHNDSNTRLTGWLWAYEAATPGCQSGANMTWLMLESSPQPDCFLCILPDHGGQSSTRNDFGFGAPELAIEITVSSTAMDFGPKLALYQRAGVREYITVETLERKLVWRVLNRRGSYAAARPAEDGVYRSSVFPGLWLDEAAFWSGDSNRMLACLREGMASAGHVAFVGRLRRAARRRARS